MFNFGKNNQEDPKKALEDASNKLNKGLTGGLAKAFMGKDFMDKTNEALGMASQALDGQKMGQELAQNGADASAEVLSIKDTGQTINMNPVVMQTLQVTPESGEAFQTAGQMMVSRLAILHAGNKIKIKYNPRNPAQFTII